MAFYKGVSDKVLSMEQKFVTAGRTSTREPGAMVLRRISSIVYCRSAEDNAVVPNRLAVEALSEQSPCMLSGDGQ